MTKTLKDFVAVAKSRIREPRLADRTRATIVHCGRGARSAMAVDVPQQMGFTQVQSMAGGQ